MRSLQDMDRDGMGGQDRRCGLHLWPLKIKRKDFPRDTFLDWAKEILEMKKRLGMEHVGLGTDGGGHLSRLVEGFKDVGDLVHLVKAMQEFGFSQDDIAAYMGRTSIGFSRVVSIKNRSKDRASSSWEEMVFTEKELSAKRVHFLKKVYSRGFVEDG